MPATSDLFSPSHFAKVRLAPEDAEPLPHWAYTSPVWFERERERVFARAWNYAGHVSQLPGPGDYLTLSLAGVPLILTGGCQPKVEMSGIWPK